MKNIRTSLETLLLLVSFIGLLIFIGLTIIIPLHIAIFGWNINDKTLVPRMVVWLISGIFSIMFIYIMRLLNE